jgi:hypothetical protein
MTRTPLGVSDEFRLAPFRPVKTREHKCWIDGISGIDSEDGISSAMGLRYVLHPGFDATGRSIDGEGGGSCRGMLWSGSPS